jgi:hypothetical protein
MTYKDHFVVEVKSRGKILRIKDDAVSLPFGSEYTLFLKNLHTRRVSVNITIDGEDVLDNSSLILDGNSSTELQGFLRGNVARNSFKFIQKTEKIQQHRGDKVDDGLIRVQFAFEKPQPKLMIQNTIKEVHHYYNPSTKFEYYGTNADWTYVNDQSSAKDHDGETVMYSSCNDLKSRGINSSVTCDSLGVENISQIPNQDEGITVKGSEVNQQFNYASIGQLEVANVIVIHLKGLTQTGTTVSKPVTTQEKLSCSSCGTKNKSSFKFCSECGTFLE